MSHGSKKNWDLINDQIVDCRRCERLITHCQTIASEKRRAYREFEYWGGPVPNFGDPGAELLIVGLAPGAHGANRTGRMFTGDRSGDWLFRALHQTGFANQEKSVDCDDGLQLENCAITAICHCAPPQNRPTTQEKLECRDWLQVTFDSLPWRVLMCMGQIAWDQASRECRRRGWLDGPKPKFGHGAQVAMSENRVLLGSYHPSQQNTFTGRLTESMLNDVFESARNILMTAKQS